MRRTAVFGLVSFTGGLTLAVLALELGVRWVTPQPLQHLQVDDDLYVVNRPGVRFTYARGSEYAIPIQYNNWGFRGPLPTRDVPPCTTRIVLIGDSQTEGLQVQLEETYGGVLQRELERRVPDRRFEVVNLAVSGYGTHQELLTLKRYGSAIQPHWVVLGFFPFNDLSDNVRLPLVEEDVTGVRLISHHFSPAHRLMLGAKLWIGSVSHLYAFCKPRVKELLSTPWLVKVRVIEPPPTGGVTTASSSHDRAQPPGPPMLTTREFRITDGLVQMTRAEAQRLGAEFVVLTIPSSTQMVQSGLADDQDRLERDFSTTFERAGILHVEASEPLRQSQQDSVAPFFSVDGHLNPVGHRVIGEMLGRWLAPRLLETLGTRCKS